MNGVIESKIRPPLKRSGLLPRPRLLAAMRHAAQCPMVLVSGVAGVGKSTVVQQWAAELADELPVAWLNVDARDNDLVRFWGYLAAAAGVALPGLSLPVLDAVTAADVESLAHELASCGPFVLVLDDVHFLVEPAVLELLDHFSTALPHGATLVLVSRGRPPLRLARRAATAQLGEVHGHDLLFTLDETRLALDVPEQRAQDVQQLTGGWPIAVALSGRQGSPQTDSTTAHRARRLVAEYMTEEVLRAQAPDIQQFLLDTCVLDDMTAASANAVRATGDSAAYFVRLESQDALLIPLDVPGQPTWRHHAIVRDHLRRTVEASDPQRWQLLNRRAADFYEHDQLDTAVDFALTGGDFERAAALIARVDGQTLLSSEVTRRLQWLQALPDDVIGQRPMLRAAAVNAAMAQNRVTLAQRWIRARPLGTDDDPADLVLHGWEAAAAGDLVRLRKIAELALGRLTSPDLVIAAALGAVHGANAQRDWAAANAAAKFGVRQSAVYADTTFRQLHALFAQVALSHARLGDVQRARRAVADMDAFLARTAPQGVPAGDTVHRARAVVALLSGDLETAGRWTEVQSEEESLGRLYVRLEALLDLAMVRRELGDVALARQAAVQARGLIDRLADPAQYEEWLAEEEMRLGLAPDASATAGARGPLRVDSAVRLPRPRQLTRMPDGTLVEPLSDRELEVVRMLRSEFSLPEIARHMYVSYNTVKTHTRVIYRKLDVSGRSAAVARARQLGYL